MTCWNTAGRYRPWSADPVDAMHREVQLGRDPAVLRLYYISPQRLTATQFTQAMINA